MGRRDGGGVRGLEGGVGGLEGGVRVLGTEQRTNEYFKEYLSYSAMTFRY
jgi:hypothetical protein